MQTHKFWLASEKRWIRLRLSARGIRMIDKLGIEQVLKDMRQRGIKV